MPKILRLLKKELENFTLQNEKVFNYYHFYPSRNDHIRARFKNIHDKPNKKIDCSKCRLRRMSI
jgi:hypothetical protein